MGPGNTPYCDRSFLSQVAPQAMLDLATTDQQDQACLTATEEADSYMRGRFQMPLLSWGTDVKRYTAYIALYQLAQLIGFAPQGNSDRTVTENYYRAVGWPDKAGTGWFPGVQRQSIHPDVTPTLASPGNPTYDLPQVSTSQARGWQRTSNGKSVV